MRIENDVKLDFSDVLIRPKRSTLTSRKNVELERNFTFIHSGRDWTGIPVVAANMDTTGTFEMARALARHKMITALHKHYSVQELKAFFADFDEPDYVAYSLGIRDEDFEKLNAVLDAGLGDQYRHGRALRRSAARGRIHIYVSFFQHALPPRKIPHGYRDILGSDFQNGDVE